MKSKLINSSLLIIGVICYSLFFIATSKTKPLDPCSEKANYWLQKDTSLRNHIYFDFTTTTDTILLQVDTLYPANWSAISDTFCNIYKDCKSPKNGVLVINRFDTARSTWNIRYGKTILFKKCQ
jgi:hypothetical protein